MNFFLKIAMAISLPFLHACSDNPGVQASGVETVTRQDTKEHQAGIGEGSATALPPFAILDVNGQMINLQDLKGKKVLVNLWASWCPPCRREMPSIERLRQSLDTGKVAFVLLSLDDDFVKAQKFIRRQKLELPIYYPAENLPALFNVQGIPTTFIFNEQGVMIRRIEGGDDFNTDQYRKLFQ